jgi:hypothetical protein
MSHPTLFPIIQKGNNSLKNGLIYLVSGYAYHMAIGNHAKFEESTFKKHKNVFVEFYFVTVPIDHCIVFSFVYPCNAIFWYKVVNIHF